MVSFTVWTNSAFLQAKNCDFLIQRLISYQTKLRLSNWPLMTLLTVHQAITDVLQIFLNSMSLLPQWTAIFYHWKTECWLWNCFVIYLAGVPGSNQANWNIGLNQIKTNRSILASSSQGILFICGGFCTVMWSQTKWRNQTISDQIEVKTKPN